MADKDLSDRDSGSDAPSPDLRLAAPAGLVPPAKPEDLDFSTREPAGPPPPPPPNTQYNPDETRETTRGDLARGLLWLLTFAIGGVLAFIGLGRLDGTVLTQSIFPSLVALAGTALGFYFGSQTAKDSARTPDSSSPGSGAASGRGTGTTPK